MFQGDVHISNRLSPSGDVCVVVDDTHILSLSLKMYDLKKKKSEITTTSHTQKGELRERGEVYS